jgi:hypothetical protein
MVRSEVIETIEHRGDLPPIAATLNKVLNRDAPGGPRFRALFVSPVQLRHSR